MRRFRTVTCQILEWLVLKRRLNYGSRKNQLVMPLSKTKIKIRPKVPKDRRKVKP